VVFATKKDALATVEMIEESFYDLDKQGASIVDAVMKVFYPELKQALLRSNIPAGSKVFLRFEGAAKVQEDINETKMSYQFSFKSDKSEESVPFLIEIPQQRNDLARSEEEQLITAYHEAAHAIVSHALLSDKLDVQSVSIISGVTKISGKWLRYLGLAKSEYTESIELWNPYL
jgi:hypothetical protein